VHLNPLPKLLVVMPVLTTLLEALLQRRTLEALVQQACLEAILV
jgi:hypothetical protein